MAEPTIGDRLSALKKRSGLSLDDIATRGGYAGRSSVQDYFRSHYDPIRLDAAVAEKLARAFSATGTPPIEAAEIFEMVGVPVPTEVVPTETPTPTLRGRPKDVPVHGTALGADLDFDDMNDGRVAVEQTLVEMTETITYVRRPPAMSAMKKVYALFVVGSSMEPRYFPGDPVFVDPQRPPALGDDVIVQLSREVNGDQEVVCALIKRLVRRTAAYIELQQYEPRRTFRVPIEQVARIHRVISMKEAFF